VGPPLIDGVNLYYGCLKGTPYKWLDLGKLRSLLLPKHFTLNDIKHFTARVAGIPGDPGAPTRQNTYLRALATVQHLQVIHGHFLRHSIWMPLADLPTTGSRFVQVLKTEEKGSDVNLASHLLLDAFTRAYDAALILSNDSDLLMPIQIARHRFRLQIILVSPHPTPSATLAKEADYRRQIREGVLKIGQFPYRAKPDPGPRRNRATQPPLLSESLQPAIDGVVSAKHCESTTSRP
jgi:uncharacterized LabA/DUF88 family protein